MVNYKVLSLITTYFPEEITEKNIDIIQAQSDLTLIIDNGSSQESIAFLEKYENHPKVRIIYNQNNLGIAHTSNQAREICLKENFDFLLNFDQDSTPTNDFLEKMLKVYKQIELEDSELFNQIGVLCPAHYLVSVDKNTKKNQTNSDYTIITSGMSSGSLIARKVFEKGIKFEDKLFVDYFDSDFFLKVRGSNLKLIECSKVILNHNLANLKRENFFGKKCITSNYSATRRYYQSRNAVFMYRKYWKTFPDWVKRDFHDKLMDTLKLILIEKNKFSKLKAMILGFWHGLRDKWQNPVNIKF